MSCLNCNKRYLGCHDTCSSYAEFKKQRLEINDKHRKYMDGLGYDGCLAPKTRVKGTDQARFK